MKIAFFYSCFTFKNLSTFFEIIEDASERLQKDS